MHVDCDWSDESSHFIWDFWLFLQKWRMGPDLAAQPCRKPGGFIAPVWRRDPLRAPEQNPFLESSRRWNTTGHCPPPCFNKFLCVFLCRRPCFLALPTSIVPSLFPQLGGWGVWGAWNQTDFNSTLSLLMRDYVTFPFFSLYVGKDPNDVDPRSNRTYIQVWEAGTKTPFPHSGITSCVK